jgi:hypothetical protein
MMEKSSSGLMFSVPGIVLIVLGIAVIVEPRILVWLVALALITMGGAILMMARFMRGIGVRFQSGE